MFTKLRNLFLPIQFSTFESLKVIVYDNSYSLDGRGHLEKIRSHNDLKASRLVDELIIRDIFIDERLRNRMVLKTNKDDLEIFYFNGKRAKEAYRMFLKGDIHFFYDPRDDSPSDENLENPYGHVKKENFIYLYFSRLDIFINLSLFLNEFGTSESLINESVS